MSACTCNEPSYFLSETPSYFYCLPACDAVYWDSSAICGQTAVNGTCTPVCPAGTKTATAFTCNIHREWDVVPYCRQSLCSVCACADGVATCEQPVHTTPFFPAEMDASPLIGSLTFNLSSFVRLLPLDPLPSLGDLVFSMCHFTDVPADAFAALPQLHILRIMDSLVQTISPKAFRGLSVLQYLTLRGNRYDSLPPGVFDGLTSLRFLALYRATFGSSLSLVSLPTGVFNSLTRLETLQIAGHVKLGLFLETWNVSNWAPFMATLTALDLERSLYSIPVIPEFVFLFPNLRNLTIPLSSINRIPLGTFDRISKLESLVFGTSSIAVIQREVFDPLTQLKHLDMIGSLAGCVLLPDRTVTCVCEAGRPVNGSCLSWCPAVDTAGLHVTQGVVTDGNYCDVAVSGDSCDLTCEPNYCESGARSSRATCRSDGAWQTDLVCGRAPVCGVIVSPTSDDASLPDSSESINSVAIAVPLGTVALFACVVVVAFVLRRRSRRARVDLALRMELRSVIAQCVQTAFLRDYGHAVHDLRDQTVSFEALEVPGNAVRKERVIGQGESGEVWLGTLLRVSVPRPTVATTSFAAPSAALTTCVTHHPRDNSSMTIAVKLSESTEAQAQVQVLLEAHVLHLLRHEHIVSLVAVVTTQVPVLVCTEYMPGGDLKTFLRACRPTNETVKVVLGSDDFERMAVQVCSALAFLEEKRILHRDVAARNVLVNADGSVVKLSDLGAARDVYHSEEYVKSNSSSARLPIAWMAPESLRDNVYTHKSDVWSFGVLLWELTSFARAPYGALGPREIAEEVAAGNRLAQPVACTAVMYGLMNACWATAATDRPAFNDIVGILRNWSSTNGVRGVDVGQSDSREEYPGPASYPSHAGVNTSLRGWALTLSDDGDQEVSL